MIFVTGGTGLVGTRLIFDLITSGNKVLALKRINTDLAKAIRLMSCYTANAEHIVNQVQWLNGDLLDRETLQDLVPNGADVYHCAAQVSFNPKHDNIVFNNNVEGTANLVNVCLEKGVRKFCHVSSIGAIGARVNGRAITEETPWSTAGKSAYSLSKYYAEMEVWRGIAEGLNAVIVNPAVILGAGDWNSGSPELFGRIAKGMNYGTQGSTSYVYVNDVSTVMIQLMQTDISEQRFILAAGTLPYIDLFQKISVALKRDTKLKLASRGLTNLVWRFEKLRSVLTGSIPKLSKNTHRIAHQLDEYSSAKLQDLLGFKFTDLDKAIEEIAGVYLRENGA